MALEFLKNALATTQSRALNWRMSVDAWADDQAMLAEKVAVFRNYADGDHDAKLTENMRRMLRIGDSDFDRFNDNYMDIVIQTLVDRLRVSGFETKNDPANAWIVALMERNRFDALQVDVHEAVIRDGNSYLLISWDNAEKRIVLTHEPAWDGSSGMLVVHDPRGRVVLGIKCWQEQLGTVTRVTLYYVDHIERYVSQGESGLIPYEDDEGPSVQPFTWNGAAIGCPVIHYPNRGTTWNAFGMSEIENAIPLQNALNRTMTSMIMTAELTGFGIRKAVGFEPPAELTPGMWLKISPERPLSPDELIEASLMEQGQITPFIEQAQWITAEIGKITRTPAPEFMGSDTASGESLKQREIGLIGKARRFQTKIGNRWEDAIRVAWRVEAAFGSPPPAFDTITARWDDVELRNDKEVVENAQVLANMGYEEEALRQMAGVFGWDEEKIQALLAEKAAGQQARATAILNSVPMFNNASFGLEPAAAQPQPGGNGTSEGVNNNG
jgi:hypothetical protein